MEKTNNFIIGTVQYFFEKKKKKPQQELYDPGLKTGSSGNPVAHVNSLTCLMTTDRRHALKDWSYISVQETRE